MKRFFRAGLSALLICVMLCGHALGAGAVLAPRQIGDADSDDSVTVMDATRVQRWLAGLSRMTKLEKFLADVNGDGRLDILDATRIQRKLAGLGDFYDADVTSGGFFGYYIEDYRFYANYDSGKARVGAPVTFHAEAIAVDSRAYGDPQEPMTYEFFINSRLVQERSEKNELIYTFTDPGTYRIQVTMYNAFDESKNAYLSSYQVVEPYDLERPVIVSTLFKDDTYNNAGYSPLYLRTEGGAGPYCYMVTAYGLYDGYEKDGFFIEEPVDETSPIIISTGYSVGDVYQIPRGLYRKSSPIPEQGEAAIIVYVRDSKGNAGDPVTVYHCIKQLLW